MATLQALYYRLEGHEPVAVADGLEWAVFFETADRTVARDAVGPVEVSTVFLGIDHRWGEGLPLLFETMVFGGPLDGEQVRSATWADAVAGHAQMLQRVKEHSFAGSPATEEE